jgi:hypothetical protein
MLFIQSVSSLPLFSIVQIRKKFLAKIGKNIWTNTEVKFRLNG